jgi:hypothetical protein
MAPARSRCRNWNEGDGKVATALVKRRAEAGTASPDPLATAVYTYEVKVDAVRPVPVK